MIGLVSLHFSVGCADIWGFQDLTGAADASVSETTDADHGRAAREAGSDVGGEQDGAQRADAGDAAPSACGSTDTVANCGGCGNVCDVVHSVDAGCTGSTCVYAGCAPGYADCDTRAPDTNGCETPISATDCAVCGATGCDATHSFGGKCVSDAGIACTYGGCVSGYADCNTTPPDTDGCETSLLSSFSCGSCGARCDTTTGTPSCDGTTCGYRCKAGRADCNASSAPDTDGCECATPQCCAGKCETIHSNGIGENFYDCNSVGTHNATQGQEACAAAGAMGCVGSSKCCLLSALGACIGTTSSSICGTVGNKCYCWQYVGTAPGTVQTMSSANCSAVCGAASDPPWN
jgi:hypothetical protein